MMTIDLQASDNPATDTQVDAAAAWIVVSPDKPRWRDLPHGKTLGVRYARQPAVSVNEAWATDLPNRRSTRAVHLPLAAALTPFELLGAARRAVELALEHNPRELLVSVEGCGREITAAACEALASAALARTVALPVAKRMPPPASKLARLRFMGRGAAIDSRRCLLYTSPSPRD